MKNWPFTVIKIIIIPFFNKNDIFLYRYSSYIITWSLKYLGMLYEDYNIAENKNKFYNTF